jgi:hypothetical protein
MRRLGILLGVLGCVVGIFTAYFELRELRRSSIQSEKFTSIMASPDIRAAVDAIAQTDWFDENAPLNTQPQTATVNIKLGGIRQAVVDKKAKKVTSVTLETGESFYRTETPTLQSYLIPLLFPIIGFVVPWGAVRVLVWIGSGFSS